jgi:hypothetical protein
VETVAVWAHSAENYQLLYRLPADVGYVGLQFPPSAENLVPKE